MKPLVSIVIPFYNDPYIEEAVESALAQTCRDVEIIIVDDGSSKHVELVRPYTGRVHYIGKANGGTASALNQGFRLAAGKYIAWLSSDDRFYPDKVERQAEAMEKKGSWISYTAFDRINAEGKVTEACVTPPGNETAGFYKAFISGNPVNGCTVMLRKELFILLGGFNEKLRYTHDLDYWLRTILAGFPFHYVPESLTAYRWHEGMGTVRFSEAAGREAAETLKRYAPKLRKFIKQIGIQGV